MLLWLVPQEYQKVYSPKGWGLYRKKLVLELKQKNKLNRGGKTSHNVIKYYKLYPIFIHIKEVKCVKEAIRFIRPLALGSRPSHFVYSSTDNFLSPIPVSHWLIFYCRNLVLYQQKKSKWWKQFFYEKKCVQSKRKYKVTFFNLNIK